MYVYIYIYTRIYIYFFVNVFTVLWISVCPFAVFEMLIAAGSCPQNQALRLRRRQFRPRKACRETDAVWMGT